MQRRMFLTATVLTLACVFVYAYTSQKEQLAADRAHHDTRTHMRNLTNSSSLDTMSQTNTSHAPDALESIKPPVLE